MIAVLKNREHPEYGELSLPLPIKASEYDHTMDMLADLGIGDVLKRDCEIIELSRTYPILRQLEGCEVNIDELDYLAKRLESFEGDQDLQFEAAAVTKGITSIEGFINLTFCCDQVIAQVVVAHNGISRIPLNSENCHFLSLPFSVCVEY